MWKRTMQFQRGSFKKASALARKARETKHFLHMSVRAMPELKSEA
jgi:hypothetical protein